MVQVGFEEIVKRLERMKFPDSELVVGIADGGILPAGLIAYKMKKKLQIVRYNYRDEMNNPRHPEPVLIGGFETPPGAGSVLLVDDVSVTGKTLNAAKSLFPGREVRTFVLKGAGDLVLFPEITSCVDWPWKRLDKNKE